MHRSAPSPAFGLVGRSPEIGAVRRLIEKASRNRLPVLLLGESGTGKEVVARAIHQASPRGQFVPIDCGSLVGTLVESDLFGHVKGAFSGAVENKKGLVEVAAGGTAFFDEIGDLPLEMQVKLLRLLQEREFRAVGALEWRKIDLRFIAATHRTLRAEVAAGRFREDLFYRLNVFIIHLPPLRDRKEDIPLLVEHFLDGDGFSPSPEILATLQSYDWPGNVRELKHCLDRMAALQSEGVVQSADMPSALQCHLAASSLRQLSAAIASGDAAGTAAEMPQISLAPKSPVISLPESERQAISGALAATQGDRTRAARLLSIGRTTLYRKMKEYGFD
ncbi:MAG: sigma-54 dependent transcriptional regulator [Bryobacteraceae bacterium]|jgi:DNA-binding NtrC family response regulator